MLAMRSGGFSVDGLYRQGDDLYFDVILASRPSSSPLRRVRFLPTFFLPTFFCVERSTTTTAVLNFVTEAELPSL